MQDQKDRRDYRGQRAEHDFTGLRGQKIFDRIEDQMGLHGMDHKDRLWYTVGGPIF
jgi:hypothetical protein